VDLPFFLSALGVTSPPKTQTSSDISFPPFHRVAATNLRSSPSQNLAKQWLKILKKLGDGFNPLERNSVTNLEIVLKIIPMEDERLEPSKSPI